MNRQASEIELPPLKPSEGSGPPLLETAQALPFLGSLKVKLTAQLGGAELAVSDLLALKAGSTIALDTLVDQPINVLAEGHVVARGTLVAIGDQFGIRLVTPPKAA